jgi:hypothetical protein
MPKPSGDGGGQGIVLQTAISQLLILTIREASRIIAEYLEPGALAAEESLSPLIAVLHNVDLARADARSPACS